MNNLNNTENLSDYKLVSQFTIESGAQVTYEPETMSKDEVYFLIKMMLDEIMELGATIDDHNDVKLNMIKMITESKDIPKIETEDKFDIIAEQADAAVDCYYYMLNAFSKKSVDLSAVFKIVHKANMDKRDPVTGKFIKRADGKIIKPTNWVAPNIKAEIIRQTMVKNQL